MAAVQGPNARNYTQQLIGDFASQKQRTTKKLKPCLISSKQILWQGFKVVAKYLIHVDAIKKNAVMVTTANQRVEQNSTNAWKQELMQENWEEIASISLANALTTDKTMRTAVKDTCARDRLPPPPMAGACPKETKLLDT